MIMNLLEELLHPNAEWEEEILGITGRVIA